MTCLVKKWTEDIEEICEQHHAETRLVTKIGDQSLLKYMYQKIKTDIDHT